LILALSSCEHEPDEDPADAQLLELAKDTAGNTWYKDSDTLLPKSPGSGHAQALLRTRFNSLAATVLDSNEKVIPGSLFPNGSVVVKELFDNSTTLAQYAVLFKKPTHPYADADGWVWGYVRPDGEVREPARNKGMACRGCHGQSGSIDFTLMNAYFP
jgi:hypothetical protein